MLKGFRDFMLRGNIMELAVAVVIGTAFTALVSQFSKSFINPLIELFTGGTATGGVFTVNAVEFSYGDFITAAFTFVITAAVVYFLIVVPLGAASTRFRSADAVGTEPLPPSEAELLTEIRDLLAQREAADGNDQPS